MPTQHTPQPWLPSEGHTGFPILHTDPETGTLEVLPETLPNALLIASAPDLLAALLFIVNCAEPGEDAELTAEGYNMACEAITKATGDNP